MKGNPLEGESMRLSDIRETMRMSIVYTKRTVDYVTEQQSYSKMEW